MHRLGRKKFKHLGNKFANLAGKMTRKKKDKEFTIKEKDLGESQVDWKLGHDNGKPDTPGKLYFKYYKKQNFVKMKIHVVVPGNLCEAVAPTFELDKWKQWNDVVHYGPKAYGKTHTAHYVKTNAIFSLMKGWYKIETILENQNIFNCEHGFCIQLVDNAPTRDKDPEVPPPYCKAGYQSTQTRNWLVPCTNKNGDDCTFMQLKKNSREIFG